MKTRVRFNTSFEHSDTMPNNMNFVIQNLMMSLPLLLAGAAGLVMVSIFRQRAASAANTAMWCLIVMLLNTVVGTVLYAVIPMLGGNLGGENFRLIYMAISFGRQLVHGAALVGLVYAVFQDRTNATDQLPALDAWTERNESGSV